MVTMATALSLLPRDARADALSDIFSQGRVDGELRVYQFNRHYDSRQLADASAFSSALLLDATSGSFGGGFKLGASLLSANSLGTQATQRSRVDTSLMGPGDAVSALGQAYLQFKRHRLLLRGGYQYLNTPWMGSSDSRVLPASYNALLAGLKPAQGWDLYALRSFSWKSRTSRGYYADNGYYPATYRGDSAYGGSSLLPATARPANGTWAAGTTYAAGGWRSQAWYYHFLHFVQMAYADGSYTFDTHTGIDPFVALQYVTQDGGGADNRLVQNHVALLGVAGNRIRSRAWGINTGIILPHGQLDVSCNRLAQATGALGNGALIFPYTADGTDPLYTTSMIRGLVDEGPGHAWKVKAALDLIGKRLRLVASYDQFTTALRGNSHDLYLDLVYVFRGRLRGLSLRDRWERSMGGLGLNPGNRPYTYNRVMLSYTF